MFGLSGDGSWIVFQYFVVSGNIVNYQIQSYDFVMNVFMMLMLLGFFELFVISYDGKIIVVSIGNFGLWLFDMMM